MTFRALCGDSPDTLTTVARFLSLLELFREGAVAFDQMSPAGRADACAGPAADDEEFEIDEFEGAPPEPRRAYPARGRSPTSNGDAGRETEEMLDVAGRRRCARRWRRC